MSLYWLQENLHKFFVKKLKKLDLRRFLKNPSFCFGLIAFILFGLLSFSSDGLAKLSYFKSSDIAFLNSFFKDGSNLANDDLFFSQNKALAIEPPDLKIAQDNFIYGISTPRVLTTQTLGDIFGGSLQERKDVTDYSVQSGDTIQSIAQAFNISVNTLLWANDLSLNASLKIGQNLVILPVSGVIHVVKSGDIISEISKIYKSKAEDVLVFNELSSEGDIFIGDVLIIPNGTMPKKSIPSIGQTQLADSFFIYPAEGQVSQGLHYYNGVDVANKCGTPIYAAASGVVQRAVFNGKWNFGMGNHVTILHSSGIVSYYGHLMTLLVKSGDQINVGDRIALMGRTGQTTGCHVHFQVMGAKNHLAKYLVGTILKYK